MLLNEYRAGKGLPKMLLSKSLTKVARTHVKDSNNYHPEKNVDQRGKKRNLHSWSVNGNWTPVVYTPDYEYAHFMWIKPSEITNYTGSGYEISTLSSVEMTPGRSLELWKGSKWHNDIIIGAGYWNTLKYIGVGIDGSYAHIWFGEEAAPDGYYND